MKHLSCTGSGRVRPAFFEERSLLPVSAACVVANAIRERLAALAGADVDLRLWPPAVPKGDAWDVILSGARVHVVRGTRCDAAFVLRPRDAATLGALLFGESGESADERALSPLECEITRRAIAAISPALSPVCGETRVDERTGLDALTYFELHVVLPVECCIGVALTREPQAAGVKRLDTGVLTSANVLVALEIASRPLRAQELVTLRAGAVLEIDETAAVLRANGRVCARGALGTLGARAAIRIRARA